VRGVVVPKAQYEYQAFVQGITHRLQPSQGLERILVTEEFLLVIAELVGDRCVRFNAGEVCSRVLNDLPVLHVDPPDFGQVAVGRTVGGDELSDNGDRLVGVDSLARAEEIGRPHAERVEVASVLIAHSSITVAGVVAALSSTASVLA